MGNLIQNGHNQDLSFQNLETFFNFQKGQGKSLLSPPSLRACKSG